MTEFFAAALSFPTVVFTVLLLITGAYWLLVIVGAAGMDVLDFDIDVEVGADGAIDGAGEGAAEGATEGAAHGGGHGIIGALMAAIRVKGVPLTIVLSLVVFFGWVITHLTTLYLLHGMAIDGSLVRGGLFVAAGIVAFPLAALTARPLGNLLEEEVPATRKDLIGKIVRVDTSRVDARFGTATADDGGGGLLLQIRCDQDDNKLSRGAQALIVSWDDGREAYEVAPFDDILEAKKSLAHKD